MPTFSTDKIFNFVILCYMIIIYNDKLHNLIWAPIKLIFSPW